LGFKRAWALLGEERIIEIAKESKKRTKRLSNAPFCQEIFLVVASLIVEIKSKNKEEKAKR
jgi:hypothetical protein